MYILFYKSEKIVMSVNILQENLIEYFSIYLF